MDPVYLRKDAIPAVPYGGDWVAGTAYKKGEFVTSDGLLFMCNIAHTSASATQPYADPAVIYARVFKGDYSATTTYAKYDGVSYAGAGFFSRIEDNIGHTPPSNGTSNAYWYCYAQRGLVGAQGDPGGEAKHWELQEVPTGTKDGANKSFTLDHTPTGQVVVVFNHVEYQDTIDYSHSGTALTIISDDIVPNDAEGDRFWVRYPYA